MLAPAGSIYRLLRTASAAGALAAALCGQQWQQVDAHPGRAKYVMIAADGVSNRPLLVTTAGTSWSFVHDTWRLLSGAPGSRPVVGIGATMAGDPQRGSTVLFGGWDNQLGPLQLHDATWLLDAGGWRLVQPLHRPPALGSAAMCWHAGTGRVVLFGGWTLMAGPFPIQVQSNDTWTWDGSDWTQATPAHSPPPRSQHAMAYDRGRDRAVVFGGVDANVHELNDTWEWDGRDWSLCAVVSTPPPRRMHAMAFDEGRQRLVMHGGWFGSTVLGDTWTYDGVNWTAAAPSHPPGPLTRCAMAYDVATQRVLLRAHQDASGASVPPDTWCWDGQDWLVLPRPVVTEEAVDFGAAWDGERVLRFGGGNVDARVTYGYADGTWRDLAPPIAPPAGTFGPAMIGDLARHEVVLFTYNTSETWLWNGSAWRRTMPGPSPTSREWLSLAYDHQRGEVVLFGGRSGWNYLADTWVWNGVGWSQRLPATSPPPRMSAAFAFCPAVGCCVLFGGLDATVQPRSDTWLWDGVTWAMSTSSLTPSPRYRATACWNPAQGSILMAGGIRANGASDELWEYDALGWRFRGHVPDDVRGVLVPRPTRAEVIMVAPVETWALTAQPAQVVDSGGGCAGSAGVPRLDVGTRPVPGCTLPVFIDAAAANAPALLLVDLQAASIPVGSCVLRLANPRVLSLVATDATGNALQSVPVPRLPALFSTSAFLQAVVIDGNGALGGLAALSNGLALTFGS